MGSVPNCRKEIPDRHDIRWFKCKLKPPKKQAYDHLFPMAAPIDSLFLYLIHTALSDNSIEKCNL